MTYNKLVNGEVIPMTAEEIAARQTEEQAWHRGKADREWQSRIAATDKEMPRYLEDLIDSLDRLIPLKDNLSSQLLDAYDLKKSIRSEKPQEK